MLSECLRIDCETGGAIPVVSVAIHVIKFSLAKVQSARANDAGVNELSERIEKVLVFSETVSIGYVELIVNLCGALTILLNITVILCASFNVCSINFT